MTMLTPAHTALHTLARLNQIVSSSLDMDNVLREIAHTAATLMDAPFVHFFIADEATHTLASRAFSDPRIGEDFPIKMLPFSQGGVGWVATHRRPLQVTDVFTDERSIALDWWRALHYQTLSQH
jgi:GAF domain-containing protein